jgi:hypothetical protein
MNFVAQSHNDICRRLSFQERATEDVFGTDGECNLPIIKEQNNAQKRSLGDANFLGIMIGVGRLGGNSICIKARFNGILIENEANQGTSPVNACIALLLKDKAEGFSRCPTVRCGDEQAKNFQIWPLAFVYASSNDGIKLLLSLLPPVTKSDSALR